MKVARLVKDQRIQIEEVETPVCGPDELLIKTRYAGVCGSDLHAFKGQHPFRKPPVVLGHETVGSVAEAGAEASNFSVGDSVSVMPYLNCGECVSCRNDLSNICKNRIVPGTGNWLGTFAEYFVTKSHIAFALGRNTSFETGALAEPFAVAVHSVRQGRMHPGNDVAVLGAGPVGLFSGIAARASGAGKIAVTDLYLGNLKQAESLFGAAGFNAGESDLVEKLQSYQPDGFDVVFLCGNAAVMIEQAMAIAKPGGRIVVTGMFMKPIPFNFLDLTLREIEFIGTQIYDRNDFNIALDLLDKNEYDCRRLVTHIFPYDQAQQALELVANPQEDSIKVLLSF